MEAAEEISFKIRTSLTEPPPLWGGGAAQLRGWKSWNGWKKKTPGSPIADCQIIKAAKKKPKKKKIKQKVFFAPWI